MHCVVGDNVLPLAAQILLDAYLAPEYLHLPRMLLSDSKEEGVPHISMMYKMMSAGMTTLSKVNRCHHNQIELTNLLF